ncbi:zinc finger protein 287-like [Phlebotomus argentipes]|uniref:zinc finger protein 287-like n=1 Tax=Phlebotomus argentipes TaxID=94469 RepID=UPI002892B6B6|nr:zinc finger protein 287-like [Phlebotomus argentipes]
MSSVEISFKVRCQICQNITSLSDACADEIKLTQVRQRMEEVTNSVVDWLSLICKSCNERLDDLWHFKITCKNAYAKYLEDLEIAKCQEIEEIEYVEDAENDILARAVVESTISKEEPEDKENIEVIEILVEKRTQPESVGIDGDPIDYVDFLGSSEAVLEPGEVFSDKAEVVRVRKKEQSGTISEGNERFLCSTCGKSYTSKANLMQHINIIHLKIKPYECLFCGKELATRYRLEQHLEVHSEKRTKIPCNTCDRSFTSVSNLRRHVNEVHKELWKRSNGTRKLARKCTICNISFKNKIEYHKHMDLHPEVRMKKKGLNKKCGFCDLEFKSYHSMKVHERVHTGEKPFACEVCSKQFRREHHLNAHRNVHRSKRTYPCDL